jgi:D-alanine-D-alanine ligase
VPRPRRIGLVFELLGERPPVPGEPADADAEYEPEATIAVLEAALRRLGCEPVRLGGPRALLALVGRGAPLGVDAVLNIAEGEGSRNREAWAPVLLELLGVPTLGSDALTLSLSLDKAWAKDLAAAAGACAPTSRSGRATPRAPRRGSALFVSALGGARRASAASPVETPAALAEQVARVVRSTASRPSSSPSCPAPSTPSA